MEEEEKEEVATWRGHVIVYEWKCRGFLYTSNRSVSGIWVTVAVECLDNHPLDYCTESRINK